MAVGAISSALGDFFKKQLEVEQQIPQLQQTMENVGQMRRRGLQEELMAPGQIQQLKQGLRKGELELEQAPEIFAMQKGRYGMEQAQAGREAERFGREKTVAWPAQDIATARKTAGMQELAGMLEQAGGRPLPAETLNQWIVKYGDVLGEHPLAKRYHAYDPATEALKQAQAKYYQYLASGAKEKAAGGLKENQVQTALANARKQAELTVQAKLKEIGMFRPEQLGNLAERTAAYDWMVENEYRKLLAERRLPVNLPPMGAMPPKLKELMTVPEPSRGVFGVIGDLWNNLFGGEQPKQQQKGGSSPLGAFEPTPVPESPQESDDGTWKIEVEK